MAVETSKALHYLEVSRRFRPRVRLCHLGVQGISHAVFEFERKEPEHELTLPFDHS